MTTRQKILANIKTTIDGIDRLRSVIVNRFNLPDFNISPLPIAFIFSGDEKDATDQVGVINYESWIWEVVILVWCQDEDSEDYIGLIHNAMAADETRGGNALESKRIGALGPYSADSEGSMIGVELVYGVQYRHQYGIS